MTDSSLTEIVAIVDSSGSMSALTDDVIGGFNAFLDEQRDGPGEARLTLALFDTNYELLHDGVSIESVEPLSSATYEAGGGTALLDAVCMTVDTVGARLAKIDEEARPGNVVVLIITDGQENQSSEFTLGDTRQRIEHQTEMYGWDFLYQGANVDAFGEAGGLGIKAAYTSNYAYNSPGVHAAVNNFSKAVHQKRSRGVIDASWKTDESDESQDPS